MTDWSAFPDAPTAAADPWAAFPDATPAQTPDAGPTGGPGGAAKAPQGSAHISGLAPLSAATDSVSAADPAAPVTKAMNAHSGPIMPIDDATKLPKIEVTAAASFPKDPALKALYIAQHIFPDLTAKAAMQRMGSDGTRLYYIANDGKAYYAEPSFSPMAAPARTLAEAPDIVAANLGPSLPTVGGIAGGVIGGPDPASAVTAAGGGMLGESIRQAGAQLLTGEKEPDFGAALLDAGVEGGVQGANQLAGVGVGGAAGKLINSNPLRVATAEVKGITPARLAETQANADLAKAHGITATPGEAGNINSLIANQRQLLRYPESSTPLGDFYTERNTVQVPQAWERLLDQISPSTAGGVANRDLATASNQVIEAAKDARRVVARPDYQAVMRAQNVITPSDFNTLMTTGPNGSLFANALQAVRKDKLLAPLIEGMPDASLPVLDMVKRYLDGLSSAAERAGDTTRAGVASKAAHDLTDALDPLFPGYPKARAAFAGASPEVDALQNGIVGLAGADRAAGFQNVPRTMFSASTADPVSIAQAKTAFIKAGKIAEWNAGLRSFLQNSFDDAAKQKQGPASSLWTSLSADARQRANIQAAMTPGQFVAFNDFMKVAEMLKRAPAEGAPTATDLGARERLAGPMATAAGRVVRGLNPLNIPQMWADHILDASAGKNIDALMKAITDPDAASTLRRLQTLPPGGRQFIEELGNLATTLGWSKASQAMGDGPPPPVAPGHIKPPQHLSTGGVVTEHKDLKSLLADKRPLKAILAETKAKQAAQATTDAASAHRAANPNGTGFRNDPVRPEHAGHVEQAATIIASNPTGRPQLAHVVWQTIPITIEVAKGGTRTAPDGAWEVNDFPAHYGRLKRTKGADNEQVDVYFGDHPESTRVFVFDQVDPKTRRFDEHKAMLGFATPAAARDAYRRAFSDGSGESRIGAVTTMSTPQFKNWLKRGKRTKPLGHLPPPRSGASRAAQPPAQDRSLRPATGAAAS